MFPATADNDTVNPSFDALLAFVSRPSVHTHSAYPTGIMFHLFADGSGPNLIVGTGNFTAVATDVATDVTSTPADGEPGGNTGHNIPLTGTHGLIADPDDPDLLPDDCEAFLVAQAVAPSGSPSAPPVVPTRLGTPFAEALPAANHAHIKTATMSAPKRLSI